MIVGIGFAIPNLAAKMSTLTTVPTGCPPQQVLSACWHLQKFEKYVK